jgi:hypothetical protein
VTRISDDFTVEELVRPSRRFAVELANPGDVAVARAAMGEAARAIGAVSHPEEPEDSYVSFVSAVYMTDTGAWFFADAKDLDAYPEVANTLLAAIVEATNRPELSDAVLQWTDREPPLDTAFMPEETALSLPPGFPLPPGCRIAGTKLVASRSIWYRAEWDLHGDGSATDVATDYYRALEDDGWQIRESFTKNHAPGMSSRQWTMTHEVGEGWVAVAGVHDVAAFPGVDDVAAFAAQEAVDSDDPEWSRRFAAGDAWFANMELRPGTSGWKPY